MTLHEIVAKLTRNNAKQYLMFCLSMVFAVALLGAFGVLLFSPTITNVLKVFGSTHVFGLGLYAFTFFGLSVFLVYADSLYLKHKLEETGVLLSLGLKEKKISHMMRGEFRILFGLSSILGLILAIPVAWLFWLILTLFLKTAETTFQAGWAGLAVAALFALLLRMILSVHNTRALRRQDIVKILKKSSENEEVKGASFAMACMGAIVIPIGFVGFAILERSFAWYGKFSGVFLAVSLAGLYLLTAGITTIGTFFKKICPKMYHKNLLYFNLVRQKGMQYTLSLFVSAVLIAAVIFSLSFSCLTIIETITLIEKEPFGYSVVAGYQQADLVTHESILALSEEHQIRIQDFTDVEFLHVGRRHLYENEESNGWSEDYVMSESTYNLLADQQEDIPPESCILFDLYGTFSTFYGDETLLYNPATEETFKRQVYKKVSDGLRYNVARNELKNFIVLNDEDYRDLSLKMNDALRFHNYMWNTIEGGDMQGFEQDLLELLVTASDGLIFVNFGSWPVRQLIIEEGNPSYQADAEDIFIPYEGNELYAARDWFMRPFSRQGAIDTQLETGAIYLLLMLFIAIVSFVAATMVIALKINSTLWQDKAEYQKAQYLGMKKESLKRLVSKQISLIYFFPTIIGSLVGLLFVNQIVVASSAQAVQEIRVVSLLLAGIVFLIQLLIFFVFRRNSYKIAL